MRKCLLVIVLSIFAISQLKAQNITGKVVDMANQPVEFANVVLYSLPDSTLISGTITDSRGEFAIMQDIAGEAFLKISYIGFEAQVVPAATGQTIVLKEDNDLLQEVVVKGYRNVYRMGSDGIVASVKNTVLETLPNANAVISQLPFLSGRDGTFTVFGKGTPVIYINNRQLMDSKELEQLSPSDIKRIQVITMPGARYDATVKAVIKITTEKPVGEGLSGMVYGQIKRNSVLSGSEYVSLNYRKGAWDLFGSVYYIQRRNKTDFDATQELLTENNKQRQIYKTYEDGGYNDIIPVIGLNYNPNSKQSAGLRYTYDNTKWRTDGENLIEFSDNTGSKTVDQLLRSRQPEYSHKVNAYYNGNLSEKIALNINTDWVKGDDEEIMDSHYAEAPEDILRTQSTRDYSLYAVKGVLSYMFGPGVLEAGGEYTYTRFLQTYNINKSDIGIDNSIDKAIQNRGALFLTYQARLGKFGVYGGVRYESIDMDYYENNRLNEDQSKRYDKFFPNLAVLYAAENMQMTLGFERKVNYPSYGQLRSNIQYSSPFLYESGNPMLQPKIENSFSLTFVWKNIQAMAGYTINENDILSFVQQFKDQPIVLFRPENVRRTKNANFGLSYTPAVGVWRPQIEFGGIWQWLNIENENVEYKRPMFSGKFNNTFSLQRNWTFRINMDGHLRGCSGITLLKPSWGADLDVSKQIFNNRLTVNVSANDIFKTRTKKWEMNYGKIHLWYDKNIDSRSVTVTIRYRFNSTNSKYKDEQASDELNRL